MHLVELVNSDKKPEKELGQLLEEKKQKTDRFETWKISRAVAVLLACLIYIDILWLISLAFPLNGEFPFLLSVITFPFWIVSLPLLIFGFLGGFPIFFVEIYFLFTLISWINHKFFLKY